eukprot:1503579-Amphidinium_carterae.2
MREREREFHFKHFKLGLVIFFAKGVLHTLAMANWQPLQELTKPIATYPRIVGCTPVAPCLQCGCVVVPSPLLEAVALALWWHAAEVAGVAAIAGFFLMRTIS